MTDTLHIYTRVSTAAQEDGASLDTQKDIGITKSKELGMTHKVWNEGAASSHHEDLLNRPVLSQLLGEIESGSIKHLFVFNNDRLSRNDITQQTIKIALQRHDVVLYTKDGRFDLNNPQDKLFKGLLDGIAEYDNAVRAERSRLGKLAQVKKGFWYGAPPPYGYKLVDKKLAIHPEESKWVKQMFKWCLAGKSNIWVKSQLDAKGVLARRGGLFSEGSINALMKNTHYIGNYNWTDKKSGETVFCQCPAIVDETVWNDVQERRKKTSARKGQNNRTKRFYLLRNLMHCGECGSQMSGRIKESKNERHYYCPSKTRDWKKGAIPQDQKWKRGKVGERGCTMVRSLNIPITDKFVWDLVVDTVSNSSMLKEGFKNEILKSKFAGDEENATQLRNQKIKTDRLMKEIKQVQSSIGDVETNNLLKKYDEVVYARIASNLDDELKSKKDELEQTRLKTKELGNQKKWLDWIAKYADRVIGLDDLKENDRQEYLEGIVDRIEVRLDDETNDHHLKITFKMGLVGDGIEYADPNDRGAGYTVLEGATDAPLVLSYADTQRMHKDARTSGRWDEEVKKNCQVGVKSEYRVPLASYYPPTTSKHHRGVAQRTQLIDIFFQTYSINTWTYPHKLLPLRHLMAV